MLTPPESIMQPNDITVGDLLQILIKFPEDLVICIPGYEGGFSPLHTARLETLLKNVNDEWYYGSHDTVDSVSDPESYEKEQFLILTK